MPDPLLTNQKEKVLTTISKVLGKTDKIDINIFYQEVEKSIQSDIPTGEIFKVVLLAATSFLEKDPAYDQLAANFLLRQIYWEIFAETSPAQTTYQRIFVDNIRLLVAKEILDKRLLEFDLERLSQS